MMQPPCVVYFSTSSGNTHHFVEKLELDAFRIPTSPKDPHLEMTRPFVLICPTYAADDGSGAVPKQVIRFLNDPHNRAHLQGVIGSGNTNFGEYYAYAGDVISRKCNVPMLYRFELRGTPTDVRRVQEELGKLWTQQKTLKQAS